MQQVSQYIVNVLSSKSMVVVWTLTFILMLMFFPLSATTPINPNKKKSNKGITIIIDPGHGGHDPGCSGSHTVEKNVSLSIALQVGELIAASNTDIDVVYTRTTDVFIPLHHRIKIANEKKADLFVSIHCNSSVDAAAHGSESYVMGVHRSEENLQVAKRENQSIVLEQGYANNYGQYDPDSPAGHIILSMFQNLHLDQSISLADRIENKLSKSIIRSRGVKQAGFVILRNATMPSILIETGFLTNIKNEKLLSSIEGQATIAESIGTAILEFANDKYD